MGKFILDCPYHYKGSTNCTLTLVQRDDGYIDLITDYGETVATITDGYDLMRVLQDLHADKYA